MRRAIASALLAFGILLASGTAAHAAPSYGDQMSRMNGNINNISLGQFLYNRNNNVALGLNWANWSSDQCSAPLIGNGPFNFINPCLRHDFGYRNLKRVESTFGRNVWERLNKGNADTRFGSDLDRRCDAFPYYDYPLCQASAAGYEKAVREHDIDTNNVERFSLWW